MSIATNQILLVHGHPQPRLDIRRALATRYVFQEKLLGQLGEPEANEPVIMVIDTPLETKEQVKLLRDALGRLKDAEIGRVFVLPEQRRAASAVSSTLGDETLIARPLDPDTLYPVLDELLAKARSRIWRHEFKTAADGLEAGTVALERIFDLGAGNAALSPQDLTPHGDNIIDGLSETGLATWIAAVKAHHSQTFRHCLLVTGVLVGFGQHLGMRRLDLQRLSIGAMLHDVGKAKIPVDILEKPGALTDKERAIMREHPELGRQSLFANGRFSDEMLDVVVHHHELLDGSGYPDGLVGSQISDIVRLMTIADIFSALIEPRAYKPAMPNEKALDILRQMDNKLDKALLRAFEPVALQAKMAA